MSVNSYFNDDVTFYADSFRRLIFLVVLSRIHRMHKALITKSSCMHFRLNHFAIRARHPRLGICT